MSGSGLKFNKIGSYLIGNDFFVTAFSLIKTLTLNLCAVDWKLMSKARNKSPHEE